jgi:hypothetical protein
VSHTIDFVAGAAMENIQRVGTPRQFDEVYFDQLNLNLKKLFLKGLSLKIGRQDLVKGEGLILLEGTPGEGPRSTYFNAAVLSYSRGKSKIDVIGILDPSRDRFLPRWHDRRKVLQNWDEQAIGVYATNQHFKRTSIEAYYFLKKEINDIRPQSSALFQPDRHISTFGGRFVHKLSSSTTWTGEFAYQWGAQHGGAELAGWGGYTWVKHVFDRPHSPYFKLAYWAMSGDDPKTRNKIEGWDPLFSQWPKWSDIYVNTEMKEISIAYETNLHMSQAEAGFAPSRKTNAALIWYHMDSFHLYPGDPRTFGNGTFRGNSFQARVEYIPNPSWKAHIHYESYRPGDFYASTRAAAYDVQAQVTYQFTFHPIGERWK